MKNVARQGCNGNRTLIEEIANRLHIKSYQDWYKVKRKDFVQLGGWDLLQSFDGSFPKCLSTLYPEHNWDDGKWKDKLPHHPDATIQQAAKTSLSGGKFSRKKFATTSPWQDKDRQKEFLGRVYKQLNMRSLDDFYSVTYLDLNFYGGSQYLLAYGNSPSKFITSIYLEHQWDFDKFAKPKNYWKNLQNRKEFVERLKVKLNIKRTEDWYQVTKNDFRSHGGAGLLHYFGDSPARVLRAVFPDIPWSFPDKKQKGYWNDESHRREFLDQLKVSLNIKTQQDWQQVNKSIIKQRGGRGLLDLYGGNIPRILADTYPDVSWNFLSDPTASKGEQLIFEALRKYFGEDLLINYRHPELIHPSSGINMELDLYVPSKRLAIEYQGEQHYMTVSREHDLEVQMLRDDEKRAACKEAGITLIEIPYWWDKTESQLIATIQSKRSDLLQHVMTRSQPVSIDYPAELKHIQNFIIPTAWDLDEDPSEWFLSDFVTGLSVLWDGTRFYTSSGVALDTPSIFTRSLPSNIKLHGTLRSQNSEEIITGGSVWSLSPSDWNEVVFYVLDMEDNGKMRTLEERLETLRQMFQGNSNVKVIEAKKSVDSDFVTQKLAEAISEGEQGLVFRKANSVVETGKPTDEMKILKPSFIDVGTVERSQILISPLIYSSVHFGKHLSLQKKISQERLGNITQGSIIEVHISGLRANGRPHFLRFSQHLKGRNAQSLIRYFIGFGDTLEMLEKYITCCICQRKTEPEELRVQVKGIDRQKYPRLRMFSFCLADIAKIRATE